MIYTIYPIKDTTIYQDDDRKDKNYGLDEILELAKFVSQSQVNGEKNSRILFIGNLNYLPNLLACRNFIIKVSKKSYFRQINSNWMGIL